MSTAKAREEETVVSELGGLEITVTPRYCKACEICVKLCPKNVLEIRDFKVSVAHIEDCTSCMLCELRCPDFAIEVSGKKIKDEKP